MQNYPSKPLSQLVPGLDEDGLDLLEKMLKCDPNERITAKDAMKHKYLADVPDEIKKMK
jgi:serine/threonine protein kinase